MNNQRGFTLIELLVVMVIALLTVAAMLGTFTLSQRTYRVQEQVSDTQQNVRIGLELLNRDARMAGYGLERGSTAYFEYGTLNAVTGMWNDANTIDVLADGSLLVNRDGDGSVQTCSGPATCQELWTDAIAIHRADSGGVTVLSQTPGVNLTLDVLDPDYPTGGFCGGQGICGPPGPIMNCISAEGQSVVIQFTNQGGGVGGGVLYVYNPGLSNINPPGGIDTDLTNGTCYAADRLVYYVNQNNQLVVSTNWEPPVVVANGAEDLQIAYFVQPLGGVAAYTDNPVSADDMNIRLVRLNLVTRTAASDPKFTSSPQAVLEPPATALENHTLSTTTDNLRRRLMTSTVNVRNNPWQ